MNFINRISKRLLGSRNNDNPPPQSEKNSKSLYDSVFPKIEIKNPVTEKLKKTIEAALRLIEAEINEEVEKDLNKLREFERIIFQELIILITGLIILLILHGAYDQLAGWIGILIICRVVEQLAKILQYIKTPQFKSFVKGIYLYLPDNKFKPVPTVEKAIQEVIRERIVSQEVQDRIKTEVDEKIKSLKLPEWIINLLFGISRGKIYKIILDRTLNELVFTISKQANKAVWNVIKIIFLFSIVCGLIRFFALEITGIPAWHFLFFGVAYLIIWLSINYWTKIRIKK